MKKNFKLIIFSVALFLLTIVSSAVYAWLAGSGSIPCDLVDGSIITQYFHCGDGSKDNPFVITRPVHYYNMVYLQQRLEGFAESGYYFQLGYDFNTDGNYEFYNYDDDGILLSGYSTSLNMNIYNDDRTGLGALLPIGTSSVPFTGTLEGNGLEVINLHIQTTETIAGVTYGTCDVGIFGYLTGSAHIRNVYFSNVDIDLTGADCEYACAGSDKYHDSDSDGVQDLVFAGYLVGHVKTATDIDGIYLNNVTIKGGTKANSNFGYFGCVEDEESGAMVPSLGQAIATQRTSGEAGGFGGSLDMKALYTRISTVLGSNTYGRVRTYPTTENIIAPATSNDVPEVIEESQSGNMTNDNGNVYRWSTATAGTYIGSTSGSYTYLYSLTEEQTTATTTYTKTGEMVDAYLISYNGNYINRDGNSISNTNVKENSAAKFIKDDNNHYYTYVNNSIYYLQNNNGVVTLLSSNATGAKTVWNVNTDGAFYTTSGGRNYYLVYQSKKWILTPYTEGYLISDDKGNYLTGNLDGIGFTTDGNNAVNWQITSNGNEYQIFTPIDGTNYYLSFDANTANKLSLKNSSATWNMETVSGKDTFYIMVNGLKYSLIFDGGWKAKNLDEQNIYSGENYLVASTSGVSNTIATSNATGWVFSNPSGSTTQIYTMIGNSKYYLTVTNGALTVNTNSISWNHTGDSYYLNVDGTSYYLGFDGVWCAKPLNYYVISSGTNYLQISGNNMNNTTNIDNATRFYFTNGGDNPSGNIYYFENNQMHYVGIANASFSNSTKTTWVNDGTRLKANNSEHFICYSGNRWQILLRDYEYIISDGNGHYLNANANYNGLAVGDSEDTATRWTFSNTTNPAKPSGEITITNGNNTYYIRYEYSAGVCGGNASYDLLLSTATSTNNATNQWTNTNSNGLQATAGGNARSIHLNGNSWELSTTATSFTFESYRDISDIITETSSSTTEAPTISTGKSSNSSAQEVVISEPIPIDLEIDFEDTEEQLYEILESGKLYRRGTYIPIRVAVQGDSDYNSDLRYAVSNRNTGYIIGGTYSDASNSGQGDIRVSGYEISNISNSWNNNSKTFSNIYTFNGGNSAVTISEDDYLQLALVKEKFANILKGDNSNVYGLHFMDSLISTDYIIKAEAANILGKTYINYDLPESSIDFNLLENGYITFMAGDYYSGNNSFFSLHQVFRDANNEITDIKEIQYVYIDKDENPLIPCVYKYKDNTYSDSNYNDSNITTNYKLAFNTDWITNPTNGTTFNNKRIYYFQIPAIAGEYALGSVSGRTGGYLLYLDIGSNGGAVLDSMVSSEGNDVTDAFNVDFRSVGDSTTSDHSILQFSLTFPERVDPAKFDINVTFDSTDDGDGLCNKGCYTITVTNKTNTDATLYVLLVDDDDDLTNDFEYAYKIIYSNSNKTEEILTRKAGQVSIDYWKTIAGFVIPTSEDAYETSYSPGTGE